MQELISVILPIYNVEEYLSTCIDSVCRQTYSKLDIILVNDGSTDSCARICDEYAKQDSRIRVIHKENGGLSDARNVGLRAANGKYVVFIDSDDMISTFMIEHLYTRILETGADIAACEFAEFENEDEVPTSTGTTSSIYDGRDLVLALFKGQFPKIGFVAWNKMYVKDLFVDYNVEYPKGKLYEDTYTTYKLLYHAKSIALIDIPLYYYRIRNGSIMRSTMTLKKCHDDIEGELSPAEYFSCIGDIELMEVALSCFYRAAIKRYYSLGKGREECLQYIKEKYAEVWEQYGYRGKLIKRVVFSLFRICPQLVAWIYFGRGNYLPN